MSNMQNASDMEELLSRYEDLEFLDNVEELLCVRCKRVAIVHNVANCNHLFCNSCQNLSRPDTESKCPKCNQLITSYNNKDPQIGNRITQTNVHCPNTKYGCQEISKLGLMTDHMKNCKYTREASLPDIYKGTNSMHDVKGLSSKLLVEMNNLNKKFKEDNIKYIQDLILKTLQNGANVNNKDSNERTPLHYAAQYGHISVVKLLLESGAIYNAENKEGKTPFGLSDDPKVTYFLTLVEELFQDAKCGNLDIISKLKAVKPDEFRAITNARNHQDKLLIQVAIINKHQDLADNLLEMLKNLEQVQSWSDSKYALDQLKKLISAAELHIEFSNMYLPMLQGMSQSYGSEKNTCPWQSLKEGSYYLGNVYKLVQTYKEFTPGVIDDKDMRIIDATLVALEFHPKHITSGYTDEAYGGNTECFVSQGQGTLYYKLLHSESKKDVRLFIEMVERNIDTPVKRFLESIKQKLQPVSFLEKLIEAIKDIGHSEVESCVKEEAIINSKNTDGWTPLHHAVNNGHTDIVNILLTNGADVTQVNNEGNTPLHIAVLKGHKEIVEVLLQHVNSNKLKDYKF